MWMKKPYEEEQVRSDRPLELVSPELYRMLLHELARNHIHSYDVKASGTREGGGIRIELRYGERFNQLKTACFKREQVEEQPEEAAAFFRDVGDEIKKAMISDYFKMMKP